jgi:hypothetical protein
VRPFAELVTSPSLGRIRAEEHGIRRQEREVGLLIRASGGGVPGIEGLANSGPWLGRALGERSDER